VQQWVFMCQFTTYSSAY